MRILNEKEAREIKKDLSPLSLPPLLFSPPPSLPPCRLIPTLDKHYGLASSQRILLAHPADKLGSEMTGEGSAHSQKPSGFTVSDISVFLLIE